MKTKQKKISKERISDDEWIRWQVKKPLYIPMVDGEKWRCNPLLKNKRRHTKVKSYFRLEFFKCAI
jgi:hypothetical protein